LENESILNEFKFKFSQKLKILKLNKLKKNNDKFLNLIKFKTIKR